jgi:hypothetical protein
MLSLGVSILSVMFSGYYYYLTKESFMIMQFCFSCAVPLTPEVVSPNAQYCKHCADEHGVLHSREIIQSGIAQWLMMIQPELAKEIADERAGYYLKAMPAWAE